MTVHRRSGQHPCYDGGAHHRYARLHLPVAGACNIRCGYCDRRHDCVNESRPGVSSVLLAPMQALALTHRAVHALPQLAVVGIAGPGDPLASARATLATFRLVREAYPDLLLCLSTNGLALPEHVPAIHALGVEHVTVTVNATVSDIGARLVGHVHDGATRLHGEAAAALLWTRQQEGIALLKQRGISVKVNTVVVPGINDTHVQDVARAVAALGADVMNCIALLPVAGTPLGESAPPSAAMMESLRAEASQHLPQMRHCARCRADAAGLLGDGGTIDSLGLVSTQAEAGALPNVSPGAAGRCTGGSRNGCC